MLDKKNFLKNIKSTNELNDLALVTSCPPFPVKIILSK